MAITNVSSLDLPALQPYRTMRRPVDHQKQGIFVAEGVKVVRSLLRSNLQILSLLMTNEWFNELRDELDGHPSQAEIFVASKALVETIVGYPFHQGVMAVGKIPNPHLLDDVLRNSPEPFFFTAVDGLTNAENLGALVRNCAAFGVQAILVGETSSSPYLRRAVRNSMGTVFDMPVVHLKNLAATLRDFNDRGITTIAAHPPSSKDVGALDAVTSCCVVFGSEGEGLSRDVVDACSMSVAVAMERGVDSLNVASASAVVLYALRARRQASPR